MTIIFVCVEIPKFFTFNDINTYSGVKEKDKNNDYRSASNVNRPNERSIQLYICGCFELLIYNYNISFQI